MRFENQFLRNILSSTLADTESSNLYFGRYEGENTVIVPIYCSEDINKTIETLKGKVDEAYKEGYVPMILQTAEDSDGDNTSAIYWVTKLDWKGDENK